MKTVAWVVLAFVVGTIPSPYLIALLERRSDVIKEIRRQDWPGDAHFLVLGVHQGLKDLLAARLRGMVIPFTWSHGTLL